MLFIEVCGTHTMAAFRSGLRTLLPEGVSLRSGPGCPVCVTDMRDLDWMLHIALQSSVRIATFGDMMRVPGTQYSLEVAQARGAKVHVVYSPLDACALAEAHPEESVVLLAIGFETTIPTMALALEEAEKRHLANLLIYPAMKTMPIALRTLLADPDLGISGLILPGHVATVIGADAFAFIPKEYGIPAAIAGFEPQDMLRAVAALLEMQKQRTPALRNLYPRSVTASGNQRAQSLISKYFIPADARWRGLGELKQSGLDLNPKWQARDARLRFPEPGELPPAKPSTCLCGVIIKGKLTPPDCPEFQKGCAPDHPLGPCMVSSEGSCAAYYHYAQLPVV
jgi:hydrogenase expression/formation protein HypD